MAREAGEAISGFANSEPSIAVTFTRSTGERFETTIPTAVLQFLAEALGDISRGNAVTLHSHVAELTTHQAAELLNVSRPFLIKLLDQGLIPHRKVGRHRRIRYGDLSAYLEKEKAARQPTLQERAAYDQEIGLSELEAL